MPHNKPDDDGQALLNFEEVRVLLNVGKTTLKGMVAAGEFPAPIILGRAVRRWRREAVLAWLRDQESPQPGPGRPRSSDR